VKRFVANVAPERLLTGVREPMILVVALLVEALAAKLADVGPVAHVDPHVSVEGRAAVEGLAARAALVGFLWRVDDFVAAQGRRLAEPFAANFADEWSGSCENEKKALINDNYK